MVQWAFGYRPFITGNIHLLDFKKSVNWMVMTIRLLDFLSINLMVTWIGQELDKKSSNWMVGDIYEPLYHSVTRLFVL